MEIFLWLKKEEKKNTCICIHTERQAKECNVAIIILYYIIMPIYKINELKKAKNNMKLK